MAKIAGRKVQIYRGVGESAVRFAGARSDDIEINNESIDVTDKGDDGWQTLLDDASVRSVNMTVTGMLDGDSLIGGALGPTNDLFDDFEIRLPGIGVAAGKFFISNVSLATPHDNAAEFTATINSSGEISWTAETPAP